MINACESDLSVRWFFRSFKKFNDDVMAVKPVPLELGRFTPGQALYERDEIQCPKQKLPNEPI